MRQTLIFIPSHVGGLPLFGFGLLLAVWAVGSAVLLALLVRRHGLGREVLGYIPVLVLLGFVIAVVLPGVSEADGLPIRGYGTMLLIAVLSGVALAVYRAPRYGLEAETVVSLAFWLFVAGIAGARLFFVIEYWDQFRQSTLAGTLLEIVKINEGGLVVYGGVIGGLAAMAAFVWRHHVPALATADLVAPCFALGLAIGRLGCFLNGCCFGGPCDLPWAVSFPAGSFAHRQQIELGQIYGLMIVENAERLPVVGAILPDSPAAAAEIPATVRVMGINGRQVASLDDVHNALLSVFFDGANFEHRREVPLHDGTLELATNVGIYRLRIWQGAAEASLRVHPTQLYSSITAALVCVLLLAYEPFRKRDGEVAALLLTIEPVTRFLLEAIRTDESAVFGTGLSISQNVSLLLLAAGIALWAYIFLGPQTGRGRGTPPKRNRTAAGVSA